MILAIIQARMTSSRLPGKVIMKAAGSPLLLTMVQRVKMAKRIDRLLVATSDHPEDDAIDALCKNIPVESFRGSLDNVLDRFYRAALSLMPDVVVRLTGDCPLMDPEIIDEVIEKLLDEGVDYSANCIHPVYPDGLDVEVMRFSALERAWREARLASEQEHVTPYIHKNIGTLFSGSHIEKKFDFSHLRWTVDEPEDFDLIRRVLEEFLPENPGFSWMEVLSLITKRPELLTINSTLSRNEGYKISLKKD